MAPAVRVTVGRSSSATATVCDTAAALCWAGRVSMAEPPVSLTSSSTSVTRTMRTTESASYSPNGIVNSSAPEVNVVGVTWTASTKGLEAEE